MRTPLLRPMKALCCTLSYILFAGASAGAPATPAKAAPKTAAPKPALRDDVIEQRIRARFARSKISVNKFQVSVQGGAATIEGRTDVIQHKGTATRLAKAAGAKQVLNRVEISEQGKRKAAANLEKGRRRAQLKRGESPGKRSEVTQARR